MAWQLLAAIQVLFSSADALLQRNIAKVEGVSARTKAAFTHLGVVLVGVGYIAIVGGLTFEFDNIAYLYASLSAFLIAIGSIAIFTAAKSIDAANLNIILMLRAVGVLIIASILLNETLDAYQLIGALLIMIAGYLASHPDRGEKSMNPRAVIMASLAVAMFSGGLVLEKAAIDSMGLSNYMLIGWGLQFIFAALFALKQIRNDGAKHIKMLAPKMLLLGLITGLGAVAYVLALTQSDNTPLIVSFLNLKVVLIIIGGYILLKEKKGMRHKLGGGFLAIAGVILLVL